jgi:hypothetical protein
VVKNSFSVLPVGQGFFYTGHLVDCTKKSYNFVYDCGSEKRIGGISIASLRAMIDQYIRKDLPSYELDMLVISHFDSDHVKGVNYLLRNEGGVKVKTVYIPYYSLDDYLLVVLWIDFFDLYDRIEKIVFVGDAEKPDDLYNIFNIKYTVEKNPIKSEDWLAWTFKFYNNPAQSPSVKIIKQKIDTLLCQERCADFQTLLQKKTVKKELQEIYENNIKPIRGKKYGSNDTSLCLFHGPVVPIEQTISVSRLTGGANLNEVFWEDTSILPVGSLLTGDISLMDDELYEKFVNHYTDELQQVGAFFVPHHGSNDSWNRKIIYDFPRASFFVSYGMTNRYGHPKEALKDDIYTHQRMLYFVNEEVGASYSICIHHEYFKKISGL